MNIDGLGEEIIDALVDAGLVKDFVDMFRLEATSVARTLAKGEKALAEVEKKGLGKRATAIIESAADAAKSRGLTRVLAGLGIKHVGATAAKRLPAASAVPTNFSAQPRNNSPRSRISGDHRKVTRYLACGR